MIGLQEAGVHSMTENVVLHALLASGLIRRTARQRG